MSRAFALAACVWSILLSTGLVISVREASAVITIVNSDVPGEGFNDPSPRSPVGGNPGTTLGAQRLAVFQRAASIWSDALPAGPEIRVQASFDPLECDGNSALLGSAGPLQVLRDFAGAPLPDTWYVAALANTIAGQDLTPGADEISAFFSSQLGAPGCPFSWYYGFDGQTGGGTSIDLLSVVLHELAHGLGFLSLIDVRNGARLGDRNDAFMVNLEDNTTGRLFPSMSDQERASAIVKPEQLHWVGSRVTELGVTLSAGVGPEGRVHMYSPSQVRPGSSVSHYSTSLTPNELMEPSYTGPNIDTTLTRALLADVGWPVSDAPTGPCQPSATVACLQGGRFRAEVTWRDFVGTGGAARVAGPGTADSALFYFYGPNNWEIVVKVLDACGNNGNDRYWVFAAAATTLEFQLRVIDTATGQSRTYSNTLGTTARPVTDTNAFASCDG